MAAEEAARAGEEEALRVQSAGGNHVCSVDWEAPPKPSANPLSSFFGGERPHLCQRVGLGLSGRATQ